MAGRPEGQLGCVRGWVHVGTGPDLPVRPMLGVVEVGRMLGVSEKYVYRLVALRRIPFLKLGHHVRFDAAELAPWLNELRRLVTFR